MSAGLLAFIIVAGVVLAVAVFIVACILSTRIDEEFGPVGVVILLMLFGAWLAIRWAIIQTQAEQAERTRLERVQR